MHRTLGGLGLLVAASLAACGTDGGPTPASGVATSPPPASPGASSAASPTPVSSPAASPAAAGMPAFDPANFVAGVDNPWYPLKPGVTFHYRGTTGGEPTTDTYAVTTATRSSTA